MKVRPNILNIRGVHKYIWIFGGREILQSRELRRVTSAFGWRSINRAEAADLVHDMCNGSGKTCVMVSEPSCKFFQKVAGGAGCSASSLENSQWTVRSDPSPKAKKITVCMLLGVVQFNLVPLRGCHTHFGRNLSSRGAFADPLNMFKYSEVVFKY